MPRSNNDATNHSRQQRTVLLATDHRNSVLIEIARDRNNSIVYSAYGHQSAEQDAGSCLGFNGEMHEAFHWYFLGNGYRVYNPRLMRFHSPDSWSPFGAGGLNTYMYCIGDPVNSSDPTGHGPWEMLKFFFRENVSLGGSAASLASKNATRNAHAFARQKAMSSLLPLNGVPAYSPTAATSSQSGAVANISAVIGGSRGPRGNQYPPVHNLGDTGRRNPGYVEGAARAELTTYSANRSSGTSNLRHNRFSSNTTDLDANTWTSTGGIHGRNVTFARVRGGRDRAGNNVNDLFGADLAPARNRRVLDRNIDRHLAVREHLEGFIQAGHDEALVQVAGLWARNDQALFDTRNRIRASVG